jgi:hypothetical protein
LVEPIDEDPYYFVEVEDDCIVKVGSDKELRTPSASPVVANPPSPPVAPAPAPATAGVYLEDPSDGSDDEDEEDEDDDNAECYH